MHTATATNIAPFFIFTLVVQIVSTTKAEIKKRGLYDLSLHQPYYPIDLHHGYNFLSEWSNLLWLNPQLYHDFYHHPYYHHGLFFDHLKSPWQIINLASIDSSSIKIPPTSPAISIPQAKLPEPAPVQPSPQQDYSAGRESNALNFQPASQQSATPNAHPPPTASHPQIGAGRLGSGSLGYVVLPNGRVALGAGSLGYTPAVTSTASPTIANDQGQQFRGTQGSRDNDAFAQSINSFSNNAQREKPLSDFLSFLSGEQLSSGQNQRPAEKIPNLLHNGQRIKETFGDFIPIFNNEPLSNSVGHKQRPRENLGNFSPELNERPNSRPFLSNGQGHQLRENLRGYASEFDRTQNSANIYSNGF